MITSYPVYVADTGIGGLSVVKSLWNSGCANRAMFLADYVVNPLGIKSEPEISLVVDRWLGMANKHSEIIIIACNTLSIRFDRLKQSDMQHSNLRNVISMVDCFKAMIEKEANSLRHQKILVMGTEYTASQSLYADLLRAAVPDAEVSTVAATELERQVARILPWASDDNTVLTPVLRDAIERADIVVLACTCFPIVSEKLSAAFPNVEFLDPGSYCAELMGTGKCELSYELGMRITGDSMHSAVVKEFAQSYLDRGSVL